MIRSALGACAVFVMLLSGCNDGTVVVKGRVLVEGEPVTNGQLILSPVGKGPRAFGMVDESGAFQLISSESKKGCLPGSYSVLFKHQLELDEKKLARLKRQAPGITAEELTVSHKSPRKQPIVIPEDGLEDLQIDIRSNEGWRRLVSD